MRTPESSLPIVPPAAYARHMDVTTPAPSGVRAVDAADLRDRQFRYYDFAMAAFVTIILCSNLIGASKAATLGRIDLGPLGTHAIEFGAGILFFPVSYVLGDVLTEVYGYARARRVVWAGLGASVFAAFMSWVVLSLPPAPQLRGSGRIRRRCSATRRACSRPASPPSGWASSPTPPCSRA